MAGAQPHCATPNRPWLAAALTLPALLLFAASADATWEFDRPALAAGQLWRAITCHWTHWDSQQLTWDAAVFLVLAALIERRNRRALAVCIATGVVAVSAAVYCAAPHVHHYRGLSGLDLALFAFLAVRTTLEARAARDRLLSTAAALMLIALTAKTAYELIRNDALFAPSQTWSVLPLAHLAGASAGALVGLCHRRRLRKPSPGPSASVSAWVSTDPPERSITRESAALAERFNRSGARGSRRAVQSQPSRSMEG